MIRNPDSAWLKALALEEPDVRQTKYGSIDFDNLSQTSNGRAVVERRDFMHTANDINARRIDNLFLITRGNIIPAVARLTHEQAAAFMVLGLPQGAYALPNPGLQSAFCDPSGRCLSLP